VNTQLEILTAADVDRLGELEAIVERGRETFIEVGNALRAIRDERLYRQTHARFEDYLRQRWDMSRSRGYQMIDAANVAGMLAPVSTMVDTEDGDWRDEIRREYATPVVSPVVDSGEPASPREERAISRARARDVPPPSNERVARGLAATAKTDPERARRIWAKAVEIHGPDATAEEVAAIVADGGPDVAEQWQVDMRKLAGDLRRVAKTGEPKDARRALARWRGVYADLDRIGKS
jgi:hypothetical protein